MLKAIGYMQPISAGCKQIKADDYGDGVHSQCIGLWAPDNTFST